MLTCSWCGTQNGKTEATCTNCGAPITEEVKVVFVDLTELKEKVSLTIKALPAIVRALLPSSIFTLDFSGNTVTLTPFKARRTSFGAAIAQGDNAVAVGAGGILIGGDVQGSNIVIGTGNRVSHKSNELEEKKLALWIPSGVTHIIVSGNGKTTVRNDYKGAQLDTTDTD